jgi:hypothetical protein
MEPAFSVAVTGGGPNDAEDSRNRRERIWKCSSLQGFRMFTQLPKGYKSCT